MQLTPLRLLFALSCVATFLFIEWELGRNQKCCGNPSGQAKWEKFNDEQSKKRDRVPGKELFRLFDDVKTFVMFIGYPRSGHSLIGSLLDAHPEIVIPHQYDVFAQWEKLADSMLGLSTDVRKYKLFYDLFSLSEEQALFGRRSPNCTLSSYCYHVPGTWQGTFVNQIRVIGDKRGGETSAIPPVKLLGFFEDLERAFKIPLRLIHVVRNPFDNIATIALRYKEYRDQVRNAGNKKMNDSKVLDWSISYYFQRANTNREVLARRGNIVLNIKSHHTIQRPRETIQKLCDHLRVTCYPDFVQACVDTLFNKISVTRSTVVWTEDQKERVRREIQYHSFLQDFTFEDVP